MEDSSDTADCYWDSEYVSAAFTGGVLKRVKGEGGCPLYNYCRTINNSLFYCHCQALQMDLWGGKPCNSLVWFPDAVKEL